MEVKNILKDLVRFNTIKDKENVQIINYIEDLLKKKGFKTEYKSKCLVMCIKEKYNLGFIGHTDTVEYNKDWNTNPFEMQEKEGKLYGLGTCDMKGGIAAILAAVLEIDWEKLNYGIKLYFTYDEEIYFSGVKELVEKQEKFPDNLIIGEPTNNIIMERKQRIIRIKNII